MYGRTVFHNKVVVVLTYGENIVYATMSGKNQTKTSIRLLVGATFI